MCLTGNAAVRVRCETAARAGGRGAARSPRRVLIYGAGRAGVTLLSEIRAHPELAYQVSGIPGRRSAKTRPALRGVRVWGGRAELRGGRRKQRADEVLLALPRPGGGNRIGFSNTASAAGVAAAGARCWHELIEPAVWCARSARCGWTTCWAPSGAPGGKCDSGNLRPDGLSDRSRRLYRERIVPADGPLSAGGDYRFGSVRDCSLSDRPRDARAVSRGRISPAVGSIQNRRRLDEII